MKSLSTQNTKSLFRVFAVLLFFLSGCVSTTTSYRMPTVIDSSAKYIFFLHGTITEKQGPYATHPIYGTYDFYKMTKAISDQGFMVISEVRKKNTNIQLYAGKIADQVKELLTQGVPPGNISVVGFSKGGAITLYASSILKNDKINFVVMAGCGANGKYRKNYKRFLRSAAHDLKGRILSIYDINDSICGSCETAFKLAAGGISSKEIKLTVGKGHGTFYQPRKEWLIPVVKWINSSE
ncbi:MAG: alpha/beta hydrolase [Deltaproteobacteria bacterium]|nr:alpha/beta hydrolase [Deltaproteobacteria bacterium]